MIQTVKRHGHKEDYDSRKLYASVFSACMSLRMSDHEAELLADTVSREVTSMIHVSEISSDVLHQYVVQMLKKYNLEVAFLYDTHRDIS